jgi:hypothetical protein
MSQSELRQIFQVEHHNDVPHYELVKIHSDFDKRRRRRRRSSFSSSSRSGSESGGGGGGDSIKEEEDYAEDNDDDETHRVNIRTSDHSLQLNLARIHHLLPKPRREEAERRRQGWQKRHLLRPQAASWYADAFPQNITYSRTEQDAEYIGEIFQDEINRAALIMYEDKEDNALLMDGTIGDEIVVKPLSAHLRQILNSQTGAAEDGIYDDEREGNDEISSNSILAEYIKSIEPLTPRNNDNRFELHDDYAFLDEDENLEDEDVFVKRPQYDQDRKQDFPGSFAKGGVDGRRRRRGRRSTSSKKVDDKRDDDVDFDEMDEPNLVNAKEKEEMHKQQKEAAEIRSDLHIIYRRKNSHLEHASDYHFMEFDQLPKKAVFSSAAQETFDADEYDDDSRRAKNDDKSRRKRQAPYIIFPEILCIVDYDGYRLHGKDNIAIKRYVISFWNGIDLRYKLLKGPSVKISIAGIIISRGRDATPYLERNRVGRDAIDSASALTDMGKYLFLERRLPVYDIAVAITKLDMCRRKSRAGECNRGTAGFAYVGGACVVNKRLEKVNSVAIVEDTGGFSGIIVAAHELGHLLGAVHDGSPPPSLGVGALQ